MASAKTVEHLSCSDSIQLERDWGSCGLQNSKHLVTRPAGERFLICLHERLRNSRPGTVLELDFSGVQSIGGSFADAAFATLALEFVAGGFPDRFVLLVNLEEELAFTIDEIVKGRPERETKFSRQNSAVNEKERKPLRNLVIAQSDSNKRVEPLGKLEAHLRPALERINTIGHLTARDLCRAEGLEINAASSKLKVLYDLRLVRRDEHRDEFGKQYIYRSLTS